MASPACSPLFPWGLIPPEGQGGSASCLPPACGLQPGCEQVAKAASPGWPSPGRELTAAQNQARLLQKATRVACPFQPEVSHLSHSTQLGMPGTGAEEPVSGPLVLWSSGPDPDLKERPLVPATGDLSLAPPDLLQCPGGTCWSSQSPQCRPILGVQ